MKNNKLHQIEGGNSHPRIKWLASLRGLMVFLVFLCHSTELPTDQDLMFIVGRIGVVGFFLMSGYLAVTSVERRTWKQFALNRFLRIYPVFWLLMTAKVLLQWPENSIVQWAANMTLFNEYIGQDNVIVASWMLSIMIALFVILMFCKRNTKKLIDAAFWIMCAGALILGVLRMMTGKPFPTAFCLLQLVGLIGWMIKSGNEKLWIQIVAFELVLTVASYMSYGEALLLLYIIAYNLGMLTFWAFKKWDVQIKVLEKMGAIGFTFFLGAEIPMLALGKFVDISQMNVYVEVLLKFVLAICLSWIITNYIENPLLAKGKEWEKSVS